MNEAAKKIGVGKLASNMISVLAETGRLGNMPGVCGEFLKIASGTRGESSVVVTTFEPLTEAQIGTVKTLVAEILGTKQVEVRVCVLSWAAYAGRDYAGDSWRSA